MTVSGCDNRDESRDATPPLVILLEIGVEGKLEVTLRDFTDAVVVVVLLTLVKDVGGDDFEDDVVFGETLEVLSSPVEVVITRDVASVTGIGSGLMLTNGDVLVLDSFIVGVGSEVLGVSDLVFIDSVFTEGVTGGGAGIDVVVVVFTHDVVDETEC